LAPDGIIGILERLVVNITLFCQRLSIDSNLGMAVNVSLNRSWFLLDCCSRRGRNFLWRLSCFCVHNSFCDDLMSEGTVPSRRRIVLFHNERDCKRWRLLRYVRIAQKGSLDEYLQGQLVLGERARALEFDGRDQELFVGLLTVQSGP
jgi:hypothetical protein